MDQNDQEKHRSQRKPAQFSEQACINIQYHKVVTQNNQSQENFIDDIEQSTLKKSCVCLSPIKYQTSPNMAIKTLYEPHTKGLRYKNQQSKFILTPWENNEQLILNDQESLLTGIPQSKQSENLSRSLQINLKNKKLIKDGSQLRSSSLVSNHSKYVKNINETNRKSALSTVYVQNYNFNTQNFKFTNQQKARVKLDYLVHQKKNKKMSKYLKIKSPCSDRANFKQNKSQHLIEALQKLSHDNILSKSIDRAVDVIRKRSTNSRIFGISNSSSTPKKQNYYNWSSCQKLNSTQNHYIIKTQNKQQKKKQTLASPGKVVSFLNISHLQNQSVKIMQKSQFSQRSPEQVTKMSIQRQKYKLAFKPKRNWLITQNKCKHPLSEQNQNSIKICNNSTADHNNKAHQRILKTVTFGESHLQLHKIPLKN